MWARKDGHGLHTWHFAPDGEHTQCGILIPPDWIATDGLEFAPGDDPDNRVCINCSKAHEKAERLRTKR